MRCQRCEGEQFAKAGFDRAKRQLHRCTTCRHRQTARWYLRFRLPYADVSELLAERGVHVDPSSVFDWVQQFTPLYQDAARPKRRRVGRRWSINETYVRIAGQWRYAFRAIDEDGQVIDVYVSDVYVSPTRDTSAATAFLTRAIESSEGTPYRATTDKAPIYPPACQRSSTSLARWSNSASSATISISRAAYAVCAGSGRCPVPRVSARDTDSCAICAMGSTI